MTSGRTDARPLPREVTTFLVQLSIALAKSKTYPDGHPALETALSTMHRRLAPIFETREELSFTVARNRLLFEGAATEQSNTILRDLAERLHRHQIGGLTLRRGVPVQELSEVLRDLGDEGWRQGTPLGLAPPERLQRWAYCRLEPLALDRFALAGSEDPFATGAEQAWMQLASSTLRGVGNPLGAIGEGLTGPALDDPERIAGVITARRADPEFDRSILEYLRQLSGQLAQIGGDEGDALRGKLSKLLGHLGPDTLKVLLEMGGDLAQRQQLVLDGARALPVQAILDLLTAAAQASAQDISQALASILTKMARHAESESAIGEEADHAVRDAVRQLVANWNPEDPRPGAHRHLLEILTRHEQGSAEEVPPQGSPDMFRVLQMAIEIDQCGPSVLAAAERLADTGSRALDGLIDLLDRSGESPAVTSAVWSRLADPVRVRRLAEQIHEGEDLDVVSRFMARMGVEALAPFLDALEAAEDLSLRRQLIDRIADIGPKAIPALLERLERAPWYLQRNILVVLATMPEGWPDTFSPVPFARHDEPRVRREAVRLMLRHPRFRDQGLHLALGDQDPGVLRAGLSAATEECPPSAVPLILGRLTADGLDEELRSLAVRALGAARSPIGRDWLVRRAQIRTRWLRRKRIAPKSPELLAVLGALATHWPQHAGAVEVLSLAARSRDPEIQRAARGATP